MRKIINYITSQTVLAVMIVLFAVAPAKAWAAENSGQLDLSIVMAPETDLTVYVDGQYSGALSESYGFGDTATITAPEVSGKTFSHWEADGSVISYAKELKLTMNAHTTLYAVYANEAPTTSAVAGFTSITRTNEGDKISFQATAGGGTVEGAGIVYSTTATGNNLKIGGGAGVTQVAAEKLTDSTTSMPDSILDNNNCWMLQIKPTGSSTVYHARAYVTVGGNTTYGDVKDVKLSELESGISMIANLEGFEPGTDDLLEEIAKNRANNPASVTNAPTAKNLTYNGSAQELVTAGTATGGEMQYALGTDATTAPANNLYTTSIPTATSAGTYYVWYKAAGDGNHTDSPEAYVTVTISKPAGGTATIDVETSATTYGDSIEFHMQGVPGQEYIIVPKGTVITDASWSDPVLPVGDDDYYSVTFDKLEPATEYEIYTRVAATTATAAGEPVKADIHTELGSISSEFPGVLVGTTVTVNPEPDTVTGLSYKWYQNDRIAAEEGYYIDKLTEISGVSGNSYTFSDKDAGKCIHVKIFKGSLEVGEWDTYEPVSYGKAVFNSMGGSFVADQTGLVYNSRITKPEDPVRAGYTFEGWFKEGDAPGTASDVKWDFDTEPVVWETTTLLAKWTANTEKTSEVDFIKSKDKDGNDIETSVREVACGNLNDFAQSQPEDKVEIELVVQPKTEEEIKNNEPAALESIMKAVEQTFKGTNEGNRKSEFLDMSVVKTVNSVKKAVSDTDVLEIALRYNMTGKFNPMIFRYHNGNTAAFRRLSARPARGSYTDGTFHVEGSGADAIIYIYSGRFSTYSIAYTAEQSWQVTFDDRNGNADQSIVADAKTVTEPANPSRSGYTFGGWYKDAACTNAWNFTTDTVTGDITLYAKWTAQAPYVPVNPYVPSTPVNTTHTIKFDANGGSGTMASVETSGAATIPANKFTREGYVFEGWNTKADGSGVSYMDKDDISPSADITLYAQWKTEEALATPTPEPVPATVDTVTKEEKAQGKIDINSAFKVYQSGKKVVAEWGEVEDADLYEVYATYCGGTYSLIKTVTDGSLTCSFKKLDGVKIDFSKNFKVYVAAYRTIDGEKKLIAKTIKAHVVGSENKKRTNASSIELEKSKYSVKVGNTFEIKATTILVDPKKKQLSNAHAAEFRYLSTDTSIAKVSKDGTVTGVSKGTCYIWVYSRNGLGVKVKVTVK